MSNFPLFAPSSVKTSLAPQLCVRHPRLLLLGMDFHSAVLPRLRLPFLTGKVRLGIPLCSLEMISYSRYASHSLLVRRGNNISFVFPVYRPHSYSKAQVCLLFQASPLPGQDCHLPRARTKWRRAHLQKAQSETLARPSSEVFGSVKP